MRVQVRKLPAHDAGHDIAHAVVVADLLVLVPGGRLPALRGPFPYLVGVRPGIREEHSPAAARDDLVAVKADGVVMAQRAGLHPFAVQPVLRPQALGGVLYDQRAVGVRDPFDLRHPARRAVQVRDDDQLHVGVDFKRLLQRLRVHVPGVALRVDKDRLAVLVGDGVDRSVEGHVRGENPPPGQGARVRLRLAIELFAGQLRGQMQRGRSAGNGYGIFAADILGHLLFNGVDVLSNRR